jgi:serpin B
MKKILLLALAAAMLLGACSSAAAGYEGKLVRQSIEPLNGAFVSGMADFGFAAASALYETDANLALSPASISLALCMARAGAKGDTAAEMSAAMGLTGLSDEEITQACKALMWRANTGGMETANAVWLLDGYEYNDGYINTVTEDYMADLKPLVIPGAMDAVNAWAKDKTHGRIDKILSREPVNTRMILANALYYLGEWEQPFESGSTYDSEFAAPSGAVAVPFMHSEWPAPYYSNNDFSMISLRFKSKADEGRYAMAFLLPAQGSSADALLGLLNGDTFKAALNGAADDQPVSIRLPKFEFSFFSPLEDTLKAMGMQKAFIPGEADFSGMTDAENLYISSVLHKCYVRIDELGAEAAAVTTVEMTASAMPEPPPLTFYADRPFLFAIYSLEDGAITFLGVINDPSQK